MRLDFNILWVEDQPDAVKAQRGRIDFLLRKEGFRALAEFAKSVNEASNLLKSDIFGDHVDLILMDYDLGRGPNGTEGIEMVRDSFPFKDIVFYSASGVQKLRDSLSENQFQGIFYSSRQDLPDTTAGVFRALVKKVLDIEHSRGIVLGATSEIDHFINEAIKAAFTRSDEKLKVIALEFIAKQLRENQKTFDKDLRRVGALTDLTALADFHGVYTSAHRLRLLRRMLEAAGTHAAECESILKYSTEVIPRRNELAHVHVVRKGFSRKIIDRLGKELTGDDMRDLRVALLEHHELFEGLIASLRPKIGE
jgi:CheY-like chemotaxis protein